MTELNAGSNIEPYKLKLRKHIKKLKLEWKFKFLIKYNNNMEFKKYGHFNYIIKYGVKTCLVKIYLPWK